MEHISHSQEASNDHEFTPLGSSEKVDRALTPELRTKVNFCASQATILGSVGKLCELTAQLAAIGAANDPSFHDHGLFTRKAA